MTCIDDRVDGVIAAQFGLDENRVTEFANIQADFGADSLDALELTMALEDEFGIEISDTEAEQCATVGDVRALIHVKLPGIL